MIGEIEQSYAKIKNFGGSYYVRIPIELIKIREWKEGNIVKIWIRNVNNNEEQELEKVD